MARVYSRQGHGFFLRILVQFMAITVQQAWGTTGKDSPEQTCAQSTDSLDKPFKFANLSFSNRKTRIIIFFLFFFFWGRCGSFTTACFSGDYVAFVDDVVYLCKESTELISRKGKVINERMGPWYSRQYLLTDNCDKHTTTWLKTW